MNSGGQTVPILQKEPFQNALEVAKLGLAKSPLIPILQTFKINGSKITAWNDVLAVTVDVDEHLADQTVCPRGLSLYNFVKKASEDYVILDMTDGFTVKSGQTTMSIETQDPEAFPPVLPDDQKQRKWSISVDPFEVSFALDKCLKTTGNQNDFIIYNSLCIGTDPETGNLTFYSSDSTALSKYQLSGVPVGADHTWVLVPKDFAKALSTAIGKLAQDDDSLNLVVDEGFVKAELHSGAVILTRRISGTPPNYNQPIDKYVNGVDYSERLVPVSEAMVKAVNRVSGLVPVDDDVTLSLQSDKMVVNYEGKVVTESELPEQTVPVETKVSISRLNRAVSAGDFFMVTEDVVAVFNGPVEEATYVYMISASK